MMILVKVWLFSANSNGNELRRKEAQKKKKKGLLVS